MKSLILMLTLPLLAQNPTSPASGLSPAEAMKGLSFLEGRWVGEGSMALGPGPRVTFQQTEEVAFKAGGSLLAVEGNGTHQGRPVHQAFAVIAFDPATRTYRMRSWLANGLVKDFTLDLKTPGKGYTWGWEDPRAGKIRYAMTLTSEGRWHELGERSADGTTWVPFFEMTLTKVGATP